MALLSNLHNHNHSPSEMFNKFIKAMTSQLSYKHIIIKNIYDYFKQLKKCQIFYFILEIFENILSFSSVRTKPYLTA